MIARDDLASARLESLRDRGEITHIIPTLTAIEERSYLDWRKLCLQRQSYLYKRYLYERLQTSQHFRCYHRSQLVH